MTDFTTGVWCSLEMMGHVQVFGIVTEEEHFGLKMGRIEIPVSELEFKTQFFGGSSVYRLSPCTEELARRNAGYRRPAISEWSGRRDDSDDDDQDECDDDVDDHSDDPVNLPF